MKYIKDREKHTGARWFCLQERNMGFYSDFFFNEDKCRVGLKELKNLKEIRNCSK